MAVHNMHKTVEEGRTVKKKNSTDEKFRNMTGGFSSERNPIEEADEA